MARNAAELIENNPISAILRSRYEVSPTQANATTVLWAAERLADTLGEKEAGKHLRKMNTHRVRLGLMPAYPKYSERLFNHA